MASGVALDMPHWMMPSVLLWRTAMAIETAGRRGAFVRHCQFCHQHNRSQRPCYGPLKLYNVISLLLCFGHPPMTMDAILATIVASG